MTRNCYEVLNEVLTGQIIVNIGQLDALTAHKLNKLVDAGTLAKWRGKWYPVAGASWGIGPDKTCWGLIPEHQPELLDAAQIDLIEMLMEPTND